MVTINIWIEKWVVKQTHTKNIAHTIVKYFCFQQQQRLCRNSNTVLCSKQTSPKNVDKHDIADSLVHSNLINQCINNLKQHELYCTNCLKGEKSVTPTVAAQAPQSGSVTSFSIFLLHLPEAESCSKGM